MVLTEQTAERVVCLRGEFDAFNAGALSATIAQAMALGEGDLVVDLSGVEFMSVTTVGVLCHAGALLRLQSRSLVLRAPSKCAKRVLELCGAADLFEPSPAVGGERAGIDALGEIRPIRIVPQR